MAQRVQAEILESENGVAGQMEGETAAIVSMPEPVGSTP
jgi:hypothetical protein